MGKCLITSIPREKVIRRGLVSSRLSVRTAVASRVTSGLVVNVFVLSANYIILCQSYPTDPHCSGDADYL